MLTALILVCSLTVTPDLHDCTRDNAISVVRVPEEFRNPATCFMEGQAYLAGTTIGQELTETDSVRVMCVQSKTAMLK